MALSQSSVLKLYHSVIEDVISGVRDSFLDDGVDEQVLQELKQIWESKLMSSKAVDQTPDPSDIQGIPNLVRSGMKPGAKKIVGGGGSNDLSEGRTGDGNYQDQSAGIPQQPEKLYPVQITLPAQQGCGETAPRVLTIQVPESAITGNQLQSVLTGPLIGATLALPTALATSLLQQHVTAALRGHQSGSLINSRPFNTGGAASGQVDGVCDIDNIEEPQPSTSKSKEDISKISLTKRKKSAVSKSSHKLLQTDGGIDTSDEDEDDDEDDDIEDEDEDKDEDQEDTEGGAEEEPLNSGDDVSDEDVSDLFDTDNVVVCQYDKITRSRNKWKFYLKDGIMNLSGKDFVFQKSNGDAEW